MNVYYSDLSVPAYIAALREQVGLKIPVFGDCLNGIVLGRFFSVAFYSPYEWNRRISCECNRAIGYVKEADGKTEVHFIRSKGVASPFWILLFLILFCLLGHAAYGGAAGIITGIILTIIICGGSALASSVTDAGVEGENVVSSLLRHPENYYTQLH